MKELIYMLLIMLVILILGFRDTIKAWFEKPPKNYSEKESVAGIKHWVPVKRKPKPRKYPSHDGDIIDEWVDSLECSEVFLNGNKIYVMDQDDILQLKKLIQFKYGYIID